MKSIKISDDGKGLKIDVEGLTPLEAMNFLTAAMVSALQRIQPPKKENIVKPNINQAMGIHKSRLN